MNLKSELESAIDCFQNMKKAMCEREGGPCDLIPMLHFKYKHLKGCCGALLMDGHPMEVIPSAWRKILDHGIPEFVMVVVEGYASVGPVANYERGSMEEDFKNNPDSTVKEVLTFQAVDIKTGEQMTAFVPYRYGDDGLPVFDKANIGPCEGEAMNCRAAAIFKACREATLHFLDEAA